MKISVGKRWSCVNSCGKKYIVITVAIMKAGNFAKKLIPLAKCYIQI